MASSEVTRVASRARSKPASGSRRIESRPRASKLGKSRTPSSDPSRSTAIPCSLRTRSLASSQPWAPVKNHATPDGTNSSVPVSRSSSRQRSSARRAERVYQSLVPCEKRISLDSPPDAARTSPGGYCSTSVTSQPLETSRSASEPPKIPAPTTTALRKRDRLGAAVVEPPGRELPCVGAEDQPGPRSPQAGPLEIGA